MYCRNASDSCKQIHHLKSKHKRRKLWPLISHSTHGETVADCNCRETGQMLLLIRPVTVYLSTHSEEHRLPQRQNLSIDYLLSFRNTTLGELAAEFVVPLSSRTEEVTFYLLFSVTQLARLSWAFRREKKCSDPRKKEFSNGCTLRLFALTGIQTGGCRSEDGVSPLPCWEIAFNGCYPL